MQLEVLSEIALKGILVVALAGLLCAALRRMPAAVRHAVWCAALAGLLALPVLQVALPALSVPVPVPQAAIEASLIEPVAPEMAAAPAPALAAAPAATPYRPGLFMVWALGALLVLGRLAAGFVRVHGLAREAAPVTDPSWLTLLDALRRESSVARPVALLRARSEITPLTWGMVRPSILIPAGAGAWTAERRRVVLLHELAHIARRDALNALLSGLACALHWFNPLVWFAAHRQRIESEHACDDRVLAAGTRASDYAGHLLAIARGLRETTRTGAAALAMARPSQIESRLLAILAPGLRRRPARVATFAVVAVLTGALLPLAAAQPSQPAPPPMPTSPAMPAPPSLPDRPIMPPAGMGTPDQGFTFSWADNGHQYALQTRGEVTFSEDGSDVRQLGKNASFIVQETGSAKRRLHLRPGADGSIQRTWAVDGASRPYDAEAGRWLADALASFRRQQAARRDEMRSLTEHEAEQRRGLRSFDSDATEAQPPADEKPPLSSSPSQSQSQIEQEAAAQLMGNGEVLDAYLKQEAEFRNRLLGATAGTGDSEDQLHQALQEEIRRSQEKQKDQGQDSQH